MIRCTSGGNDNSDNDQAQEAENLDGCGDYFGLTEELDVHQVDSQNCGKADRDDNRRCDVSPS